MACGPEGHSFGVESGAVGQGVSKDEGGGAVGEGEGEGVA